jgi:chromosome segregation ATPase
MRGGITDYFYLIFLNIFTSTMSAEPSQASESAEPPNTGFNVKHVQWLVRDLEWVEIQHDQYWRDENQSQIQHEISELLLIHAVTPQSLTSVIADLSRNMLDLTKQRNDLDNNFARIARSLLNRTRERNAYNDTLAQIDRIQDHTAKKDQYDRLRLIVIADHCAELTSQMEQLQRKLDAIARQNAEIDRQEIEMHTKKTKLEIQRSRLVKQLAM